VGGAVELHGGREARGNDRQSLVSAQAEDNTSTIITTPVNNGGANYYLGLTGTNNYLEINSGGQLYNCNNGYIGSNGTAIANSALVTGSGEVGDLRYPSLQAIKAGKTLPQTVLGPADLDVDPEALGRVRTVSLAAPSRERRCTLVDGDTPEEAGRKLALLLRQEKVV